ncbi:serine hydrolase domain-containing protein [Sediminicoccus sp. KRV36]|uniref:serine hydrolase domain-containing protein n=1 Tax=Sediminicoccus sp. KRV36 TaxID=3133721 RepID=UPI00200D9D3D|nr:serine hydrolase domain-containing protein [Sediminicoccus rosea]UPY36990.1 beta-lactamase family protein [Sediminicoccus rosea]
MRDLDLLRLERRVGLMLAPLVEQPGAAVGVTRDGVLLLRRSVGLASMELHLPLGVTSCFRIASVSKQFTCAAILLLERDGLLRVTDPVRQHLPELPESLASITLDHLMRNSSGLRDMLELLRLGGADLATPVTEAELDAAIARQETLNFTPGSRFLYSNSGFRLLGRVIERVSGQRLASFLDERIFQPMGMTRTHHTPDLAEPVRGLVTGYLPHGQGGFVRAQHGFPLGGEGGLVSCVEDLALWARSLAVGGLGGGLEAALEATTAFNNGVVNRYALGLDVESWRGLRVVSHGGLWPGFKTAFLRVPEKQLAVIVIANNASLDPHHMALQVLEAALDGDPALAPAPPALDHAAMTGSWLCEADGLSLDVSAAGVARMHGVPFALVPAEDGRMTARRGAFPFRAALPEGETMAVEFDAGHRAVFRRATPVTPPALDGVWHCRELAAEWHISGQAVRALGPIRRGPDWGITAFGPRHLRIAMPSALYEGWADAVLAEDGQSLVVNAGRARGLVFTRSSRGC